MDAELQPIRLPILVTGLSGVPGYALFRFFQKRFPGSVYGIRAVNSRDVNGPGVIPVDAEDVTSHAAAFEKYRFGTVLDASGNCALKACECDTALSKLLNYTQGVEVARLAAQYQSTLIRLSTDMVFSGASGRGGYKEEDPKDPIHNYGKHMSLAEEDIQKRVPSVVILRVPLPMDYAPGGEAGAIDWITHRFRPGRPATLYFDEYRKPIYGGDLCRIVEYILEHPFPAGIYHCGGRRTVSLYEIGQIINVVGGYAPDLLQGCNRIEAGPLPPRVGNLAFDCSKLWSLLPSRMVRPWPEEETLVPDSRDWHKKVDRSRWGNETYIDRLLVQG
jgi:dTDP-4-dehydrorhamnose reductase